MLRIRFDKDLKDLEKFGFRPYYIVGKKHYEIMYKNGNNIKVDSDTRFIHLNFNSVCNGIPNVIYDLMVKGFIEQVKGGNN